ncbi:hypothetical protein YN1HA_4810 [Sulfurisphaera ohwakuensis]
MYKKLVPKINLFKAKSKGKTNSLLFSLINLTCSLIVDQWVYFPETDTLLLVLVVCFSVNGAIDLMTIMIEIKTAIRANIKIKPIA